MALVWALVLLGAAAAGARARWIPEDAIAWTIWADRDLTRAAEAFERFPTSGPELTRGSRTPGGGFSLWMALQLRATRDPVVLHRVMAALNVAGWAILALAAARAAGAWAGAVVLALGMASPAQARLLAFVGYNPNYPLLFAAAAYALFLSLAGRTDGRGVAARWAFLVATTCMAAQMHLSFLLLLPGMALALRRELRSCGRRCVGLTLAVFALAYGPFFLSEIVEGWVVLGEVTRHHRLVVNSPWSYPFTSPVSLWAEMGRGLRNLAYTLFSGPGPAVDHPAQRLVLGHLGVAAFAAAAAWAIAARRNGDRLAGLVRRLLVVMAVGLFLMSLSNVNFPDRYVLFLLPAAVLVIAMGAAAAARRVGDTRPRTVAGLGAAVLAAAFFAGALGEIRSAVSRPDVTIGEWTALLQALGRELGFGRDDVAFRTAVLVRRAEGWATLSAETAAVSFLAEGALPERGAGDAPCALVLTGGGTGADASGLLAQHAALGPVQPVRALALDRRLAVVAYVSPDGNCLADVGNRYFPTPEEESVAAWVPPRAGAVAESGGEAARRRFFVRLVHPFPWRRALEMRIDVLRESQAARAVLHSNDLRGYDGITSYHLARPRLLWRDGTGVVREQVLVAGTIGGWFNPVRAPWRSPLLALPPGPHEVDLAWDDVQFEETGGHQGRGRIALGRVFW